MISIFAAWMIADFISGFFHWIEDRCLGRTSRWAFIRQIISDNELHHDKPHMILKNTYWENINTTAPIAWTLALIAGVCGAPAWLSLAFVFSGFANLIHRFSHRRYRSGPISWLQTIGAFQSFDHHNGHHRNGAGATLSRHQATRRYCVMTNWLNPLLDGLGFFPFLERVFLKRTSG